MHTFVSNDINGNTPAAPRHWTSPGAGQRPVTGAGCTQVGMGQLKIGSRTDQLHALLGSCVGIAFLWKKGNCCALAHCLLPEAPGNQTSGEHLDQISARYVNKAVPAMLKLMGATEADYADIVVVLAGGANMLNGCSSRFQVGQQNADAARRHLRQLGLNVQYCRLGGKSGRTLTVDCATSSYTVGEIVTAQQDPHHAHA
jgi:chemotaxis protein CheD